MSAPATSAPPRAAAIAGVINATGSILAVALLGKPFIASVGVARYGAWGVVTFLATTPFLLDFGFSRQCIQRIVTATDPLQRAVHLSNLLAYAVVGGLAALVVALGFLYLGPGATGGLERVELGPMALASTLAILATTLINFIRTTAEAANHLAFVAYSSLAQTILSYLLALTAALYAPQTPSVLYYSYPLALGIVLAGAFVMYRRFSASLGAFGTPSPSTMWLTFKAGVGFGWAGVLSFAILPLNRAFLLQQPNSLATYGLFDLLTKLAEASSGVLTSAFTPLYRHFLQPSSFIAKRRLVRAGEAFVLVAWGCGVAIFMGIARPLLSFLLSKDASDIVVVAVVLLAFRASHAVAEPATRLLWAQDNKSVVLVARVLALALNVILLMVLLHATTLLWACAIAYAIPFAVSALIICIGTRVVLRDAWNGTTP